MRVLITGAAGMLGGFVSAELRSLHDVTALDIVAGPGDDGVRWVACDIRDLGALTEAFQGHDAVVHCAALVSGRVGRPIHDFVDVMVEGTWNVMEAALRAGVTRVVNISSVSAGGWPPGFDHQVQVTDRYPVGIGDRDYGLAKRLAEEVASSYAEQYPEMAVVSLRPAIICGPDETPGRLEDRSKGPFWFAYVSVHDVVSAIAAALRRSPAPVGVVSLAAPRDDSLFDHRAARELLGYRPVQSWPEL
jgi:nucleoside-diphosphate-sugar epimerase